MRELDASNAPPPPPPSHIDCHKYNKDLRDLVIKRNCFNKILEQYHVICKTNRRIRAGTLKNHYTIGFFKYLYQ